MENKNTPPAKPTEPLPAHPGLAAPIRPILAFCRHHRRVDAVGAGGAAGNGLCRHRRSAAAGRSVYTAGLPARLRLDEHVAPSGGAGHLGHGGAAGFGGGGSTGGNGCSQRFRPANLSGLCLGVRPGHRPDLSGGRPGASGFHHPVPVQAGDGRLCGGPGRLCGRGTAQQAVRRAQARGQYA